MEVADHLPTSGTESVPWNYNFLSICIMTPGKTERPIWHSILGNESRAARAEAAKGMSPEELLFISEPDADDISDYGGEVEDYCRDLGVDLSDFYGTHAENFSEGLDFPGFDGSEDMSDFQDDGDFIG